ncbi:MAG: lipopolysaccharide heptosyltransferase II [Leptospiraceae bacterium]|nr:lipopolysaccharide heptosyltransferase II [Leptospiraceae bacterium]MCP5495719.1 lipopolysaccharide heptosyltransferase II [Leptospiraceae bacterium]
MKKILIIQTAFLGDLVLTTPFVREVYRKFQPCQISILVNRGTETILENNPYIHKVIPLNKEEIKKSLWKFLRFIKEIGSLRFNMVLSPHFSHRSSLISYFSGAKVRIGYKESGFSFLHTHTIHRPISEIHEVDKLFSLIYKPDEYPSQKRPELYLTEKVFRETENFLKDKFIEKSNYILVSPSSVWETKKMPEQKFVELIRIILQKTNYQVLLSGSKKDLDLCAKIQGEVNDPKVINIAGETNLQTLACVISLSKAVVTNDSSPTHFASAFNVPTVVIYGATVPNFGYTPLSEKYYLAEVDDLSCRPCGIHGGNKCPQNHFSCMLNQDTNKIFENLVKIVFERKN